jgi:hypothetical protein
MHFLIRATIPNAAGNRMVKGDMQALMDKAMADIRPEAAYFTADKGQRTMYFVVNLESPSDMVRTAETLWLAVEADVEIMPVMTPEEFASAGPTLGQVVSKY